jgi:hypothetical protein
MALANVAWTLASNGHEVLVIDWDVEAPGLHRYFAPFLSDPLLVSTDGLMDFCFEFAAEAATTGSTPNPAAWNLWRYAVSLEWQLPGWGTIDIIPAGRQGPSYAARAGGFDWRVFYERLGGRQLLESARQSMREEYDYVLIDSRTGVADTSGICTIDMPDTVVLCFTYSNQSIEGTSDVAAAIMGQRNPPPRFFPVPMRTDSSEKVKLERARLAAQAAFAQYPPDYWGAVEIPYVPYYAYEETLAAFGDDSFSQTSLRAATERLVGWLTDGKVTRLPIIPPELREQVLAKFARAGPVTGQRAS